MRVESLQIGSGAVTAPNVICPKENLKNDLDTKCRGAIVAN